MDDNCGEWLECMGVASRCVEFIEVFKLLYLCNWCPVTAYLS